VIAGLPGTSVVMHIRRSDVEAYRQDAKNEVLPTRQNVPSRMEEFDAQKEG
jgi:hypothetical protein